MYKRQAYGHSLIVDPWGHIIEDGGDDRGVIVAQIHLAQVSEVRSKIPSLYNGRDFNLTVRESVGVEG